MTATKCQYSILFVDDEEMTRKYFKQYFKHDYTILTAADTAEAKHILEQQSDSIGVLITDQRMPQEYGIELLKYARENYPAIARLLTTAYSDLDDAIEAVNKGEILRYLTKPWDIDALRVELRTAMQFFLLRRERDQLLQEKLSVLQRLANVNQARDLIACSAGITHLRNSLHAVYAYLAQLPITQTYHMADSQGLDAWGHTKLEIEKTLEISKALIEDTQMDNIDNLDTFSVSDVLKDTCNALNLSIKIEVGSALVSIQANNELVNRFFNLVLSQMDKLDGTLQISLKNADNGVEIIISDPGACLTDILQLTSYTELLAAFLICYHHNGSIHVYDEASTGLNVRIFLPEEPTGVEPPDLESDWLDNILSHYENW